MPGPRQRLHAGTSLRYSRNSAAWVQTPACRRLSTNHTSSLATVDAHAASRDISAARFSGHWQRAPADATMINAFSARRLVFPAREPDKVGDHNDHAAAGQHLPGRHRRRRCGNTRAPKDFSPSARRPAGVRAPVAVVGFSLRSPPPAPDQSVAVGIPLTARHKARTIRSPPRTRQHAMPAVRPWTAQASGITPGLTWAAASPIHPDFAARRRHGIVGGPAGRWRVEALYGE